MIEVADIFRCHGPAYRGKYRERMPIRQRQVMQAIEQCRTEVMGGHVYRCEQCEKLLYSYHSCKNRHCPKCQNETAQQWLIRQQTLLLPVPHFMVTFTLPAELRRLVRSHPQLGYNLLFRTSAAALQQLAADPRFVGGQIGLIGVLHTWTRQLNYHPHIHYLVPAGALAADGQSWQPARNGFLVHVKPLSILFRAKFREALKKTVLFELVSPETWSKPWVVHCKSVGSGQAVLKYLATYVFRVAISNNRLLKMEDDQVTFRYKDSDTGKKRYCTLAAEEFIRRFLQHVLPKGFMKVRYYGLFSPSHRPRLQQARQLLGCHQVVQTAAKEQATSIVSKPERSIDLPDHSFCCPQCGRPMQLVEKIRPKRCRAP